ncbi:PKD domain-containing protein [Actinomyces sp. zg296]|uniref:PKD domain-containing protein n=1 Tax=Actinomyces sp. zg296 TaxID=2609289 RepID=UPI001357BB4E|nr:PKD domain-containing protein [Actinomyces sp. zg296]
MAALAASVPMALAFLPAAAPAAAAEAPAAAAAADASGRLQSNHTADPLPTVQINGVVWDQLIVGDTVYVVGSFTQARPAGSPAGTNETPRANILAYKLSTGELIKEFAHELNGAGRTLAVSEDKQTLYVGGDFNKVNEEFHSGLAAFDISTSAGKLISTFRPQFHTTVRAIGVHGDTVYAGGAFKHVNGVQRSKAAAVNAKTGETLSWAPKAEGNNAQVWSLQVSPDGTKVALGGSFTTLNGSSNPGYGLALVSASDGTVLSTPINSEVRNGGVYGAITDLKTDGTSLYGVGYSFSVRNANLEGAFKADWNGNMTWVEPCHGDSYAIYPAKDQVYVASHAHSCETIGGWGDTYYRDENNTTRQRQYRLTSFTANGEVTVGRKGTDGYKDWSGHTSPSIVDWFPELSAGKYTGQGQGAWDVTGNDEYIVAGGEFLAVDGKAQQGLVRFPKRGASKSHAPEGKGADLAPYVSSPADGVVDVTFSPTWDRDDSTLTYSLYRDGGQTPVSTLPVSDRFWNREFRKTLRDNRAPAGEHTYTVVVSDAGGNTLTSEAKKVTVAKAADFSELDGLDTGAVDLGAKHLWTFEEEAGTTFKDILGGAHMTGTAGVKAGQEGSRGSSKALGVGGNGGTAVSSGTDGHVQTFSIESWVKTDSKNGGAIVSYEKNGDRDRLLYMTPDGAIHFGVYPRETKVVSSKAGFNDGKWHHVVATLGADGQNLYVDGKPVASDKTVIKAQEFNGSWRLGTGSLKGWPQVSENTPSTLDATIDSTAIYHSQLTADQIARRQGQAGNVGPRAVLRPHVAGMAVTADGSESVDPDGNIESYEWDFGDGTTATGANANHTYAEAGTYTVTLTVTDNAGARKSTTQSITVTDVPQGEGIMAQAAFKKAQEKGWPDSSLGGAWKLSSPGRFATADGVGSIALNKAGWMSTAMLPKISSESTQVSSAFSLSEVPTGGGVYASFLPRSTASGAYGTKIHVKSTGEVLVFLTSQVGGTEKVLAQTQLPGTWTVGKNINVKTSAVGKGTTNLSATVWLDGQEEPSAPTLTASDSTEEIQGAGSVLMSGYLSGSATSLTNKMLVSTFQARTA